jgi:hypothetical protein
MLTLMKKFVTSSEDSLNSLPDMVSVLQLSLFSEELEVEFTQKLLMLVQILSEKYAKI